MMVRTTLGLWMALWLLPLPACAAGHGPGDSQESSGGPRQAAPSKTPDLDRSSKLLMEATNAFRKEEQRPELKPSTQLSDTVRDFAAFMARTDKYGHDADGSQPADRVKTHGYEYCVAAENIAYEYSSAGFGTEELAERFITGWKNSPGHRKNMLDPAVMEAGMAIAHSDASDKYYAVQVFARPKSAAFSFEIVNESVKIEYQLGDETLSLEPRYTRTHELCVPSALKFTSKEYGDKPETFQPGRGDRFVITRKAGKLAVGREASRKQEAPESRRGGDGS